MYVFRRFWNKYKAMVNNVVCKVAGVAITGDAMLSLHGNNWLDSQVRDHITKFI